jgi:hypothetical protein
VLENAQFYEEGVKFNIIPFGKGGDREDFTSSIL